MAFKSLKEFFKSQLVGVGEDRIAIRSQGCWNCIHGDAEAANKLWWNEARIKILTRGVQIATSSPLGESDQRVVNIRGMVPKMDGEMTLNRWVICKGQGKKADGSPVDDFVASTFLCGNWSGSQGASVAREGGALDKLPEEVHDRMMNDPAKLES